MYKVELYVLVSSWCSTSLNSSTNPFNIFDFKLDDYDMKKIVKLDKAKSAFFSYYDPDVLEIFAELD